MTPERKTAILDAVAAWLDAHGEEPLPAGIDPDLAADDVPPPDLASLTAAVVACRHDVQLQGKAFKRLEERLEAALGELAAARAGAGRATADLAAEKAAHGRAGMELYDRLRRCLDACSAALHSLPLLLGRAGARQRLDGIATGIGLALQHVDDQLAERGLRPFEVTGAAFDPDRMHAVGQAMPTATVPSGHVAVTVSAGFEQDGRVVRPASVVIARDQGPPTDKATR